MTVRALMLLSALGLVACDSAKSDEQPADKPAAAQAEQPASEAKANPHDAFANLSPDEVAKLIDDKGCVPVDANDDKTRTEYGVLPGAVKLSSYTDFDQKDLPGDKATKLVFYCGSEKCAAAPKAAKLASDAGYSDVAVMRAGIRGWVKAGKNVDKPAKLIDTACKLTRR